MKTAHRMAGLLALAFVMPAHADPALEHAKKVLDGAILFDGHNDLPWAIREYRATEGDTADYVIGGHSACAPAASVPSSGACTRHRKPQATLPAPSSSR
ncbi:MAG: hypothetical protein WAW79_04585 [Steroidobacteraceae bacterium]